MEYNIHYFALHLCTMQECLLLAYFRKTWVRKVTRTNLSVTPSRGAVPTSRQAPFILLYGLIFWALFFMGPLVCICPTCCLLIKSMHIALSSKSAMPATSQLRQGGWPNQQTRMPFSAGYESNNEVLLCLV